jgi:hypothetical protein
MNRLTLLFLQILLGSARLRAFGAGLLIGAVARALFARQDFGWLPPAMGAVVILCGIASIVCFTLDQAPRRDRVSLRRIAEQALAAAGAGVLLVLHLPG